jgi:glycosyltransferase involved in cell wall biosynthesis
MAKVPAKTKRSKPASLSVVLPFYNEEGGVDIMLDALLPTLKPLAKSFEIICVDDGSNDKTAEKLVARHIKNKAIKVIQFSRNFGQDAAITAGLEHTNGNIVIIMDSDMQHPPRLIPDMVVAWREGAEMVSMVRDSRQSESPFLKAIKILFYKILSRISKHDMTPNAGNFRLLDRKACDALLQLKEKSRYLYGLYQWIGFPTTYIDFTPDERAEGETKWTFMALFNRGMRGIVSFSATPLRIWTIVGASFAGLGFMYGLYIILKTLIFGSDTAGFASLATLILFFGGLILLSIGMIGEYLANLFEEVKDRPLYLVYKSHGLNDTPEKPTKPRKPS